MQALSWLVCTAALLGGVVHAQTPAFTAEAVAQGQAQYQRTCAQCHGRNMVNAGTTVYDLRRFPTDQRDRFFNSVRHGKGNMPSFQGALDEPALEWLWAYVATRGGKEM